MRTPSPRPSRPALAAAVVGTLLSAGCATNLSTLQTADTLDPMHVRAAVGAGAYLPLGRLAETKKLADQHAAELQAAQNGSGQLPDVATQRQVLQLAASLAVLPPEPVVEASGRLGLLPRFDAGFKWSSSAWRVDAKWRLTGKKAGFKVALLGGVEVYTFDVSLFQLDSHLKQATELFKYAHFENPQRYDAEIAVLGSVQFLKIFHLYLAAKYRLGYYNLPTVLHVVTPSQTLDAKETLSGLVHYGGATLGFAIGPQLIQVLIEVNAGYASAQTKVLGQTEQLGGAAVYPAAAVALQF